MPQAHAQALESMLSPGKLTVAHAKWDGDCQSCHVKFDRNAQDRLCMDCHKDVGSDIKRKLGFHGRLAPQACKSCHAEHKGRDAHLTALDRKSFDHAATNFVLHGAHRTVDCAKCHLPGKGFRVPSRDCAACHRKDDVHKGTLGPKCADCHNENRWKEARFDHETTRFPLVGKHQDVKCADCHKDGVFRDTPRDCLSCHKKDDKHRAAFGDKCDTCHSVTGWKSIRFNHDTDTRYPLIGKHRTAKCESCHTGNLYRDKLSTSCDDCHHKDDKHKGTLGRDCAHCHTERDWTEPVKFNHDKTAFPLLGKHASVKCASCHLNAMFKEAPKACIGCHRKDDRHKGSLGESCADCHNERDWKKTSFDHAKTRFALLGAHRQAECGACHKSTDYKATPRDCFACHQRDDKHEGQEGRACERCHDERPTWKPAPRFDHGLARFALLGKHEQVQCKDCHAGALFKNAKSDCVACHAKDDQHKKSLGPACGQCHNARSWKAWDFDHDTRTKYVLDGRHKGLVCSACHTRPTDDRVVASTQCIACHAKNDVHEGHYGRQCQQCHVTSSFATIRSRSGRTVSVAPRGPHAGPGPGLPPPAWRVQAAAFRWGPVS
ncbi:MAG: cytochrome c family protein [Pseudomonadota bacterium]|nr:cytochrome c family protein [Pseudomonadota bacterium]